MAMHTIRMLSEKTLLVLVAFQAVPPSNAPDMFGSGVAENLIPLGGARSRSPRKPRNLATAPRLGWPRSDLGLDGRRGVGGKRGNAAGWDGNRVRLSLCYVR